MMFGNEFNPKESFLKQELAVSGIHNNIFGAIAGAVLGGITSGLGQSSANAAAKEQQDLANKAAIQDWKYQNQSIRNQNAYGKESVAIARRNQDVEITGAEQQAMDNWSYNMTIRDFDYNNQMQAYGKSKKNEALQLGFNEAAFQFANQQQDNYLNEQNLAFDFEDLQIDADWANGFRSFELNQKGLDIEQQGKRASDNFSMQKSRIESLKNQGTAKSKGQSGRTAAKNVQAAIAEGGLAQAEIAESTFQAGRQYQNSSAKNVQNIQKLSDDLEISQRKVAAGRVSLRNSDKIARKGFKLDKLQADMNAWAKVMAKPNLAPDLPMPPDLDLYKGTIQDAYEIEELPKPIAGKASQPSPWLSGISAAAPGIGSAVGGIAKQNNWFQ